MAYGGVEVVKGVDLDLFPGEVHAIIGENGAGKSTVAKAIAGVVRPSGGTITPSSSSVRDAMAQGIALIHQEPLTFPDLTVTESIFVGHLPRQRGMVDWVTAERRARDLLAQLGVPLDPRQTVGHMSIADQQMVELAAALSLDAKVILMDETTASLTPKEVEELFRVTRKLREEGCAIAFVSHHLDEVMEIADRVTVLRDGERVAQYRRGEATIPDLIRAMVGRDVPPPDHQARSFGPEVLQTPSLRVRAGEIVGIGGLVGAGRTEFLESLFGLRPPTGTVRLNGKPVNWCSPAQAMNDGVALVPEDRQHAGLHPARTLAENATLPMLPRWFRRRPIQAKQIEGETDRALRGLQTVFQSTGQPARTLSGGNQQKVVLARWLLTKPKLLLLDEPTRGVDIGAKAEVHRLIRELAAEGLAIVMVSSDLPELLALSDRVVVMRGGQFVAEFPAVDATPERVMAAATGQEAHAS